MLLASCSPQPDPRPSGGDAPKGESGSQPTVPDQPEGPSPPEPRSDEPQEKVEEQERPKDTPEDERRRERLRKGKLDAGGIRDLATSRNPRNIDAVAAFFSETENDYALRVAALKALRSLRDTDASEYERIYPALKAPLSIEASRGLVPEITDLQIEALAESLLWHAERNYEHALYMMRDVIAHSPHDKVKYWAARALAFYRGNRIASDVLWSVAEDKSRPARNRAAAIESLLGVHGKDLDLGRLEKVPLKSDDKKVDLAAVVRKVKEEVKKLREKEEKK